MRAPLTTDRPLTLDVTDCGPILRACVELRPLTVFVGPSNTGKSWLATLAYALQRSFGTDSRGWRPWFRMGSEASVLPDDASSDLARIAAQLTSSASGSAEPTDEDIELTAPIEAAIRSHLGEQGEALGEEIERCFGVDAGSHLVRKGRAARARILLRHTVEGASAAAEHVLTFGDQRWTFRSTIPDRLSVRSDRHRQLFAKLWIPGPESEGRQFRRPWDAIHGLTLDVLPQHRPAFYLPADRTGLMNAHSTVVSALIQSATRAGARRAGPLPPLSGVRGDFLEQLVEMVSDQQRRPRRGRERLRRLGRRIEDGILGGAVKVGGLPGVAYPHFTYHPKGWEVGLPLTNTSSMVSELAPVVLYLQHVVAPDDLLIIDEPESHLHPAMQVAFTRKIAEIVGAGVRVIVTTHSEWVLEELGNVVGRSGLTNPSDKESELVSLDPSDVGVWLFESAKDGGGSTVKEIRLDADIGLYPSGFDAVATALHNHWAGIADARGDAG